MGGMPTHGPVATKGPIFTAHSAITATTTSSALECAGFNSVLVECTVTAITSGNWVIELQGCFTSGGTYGSIINANDVASPALTMKHVSPSLNANGNYVLVFKGVPEYIKIVATRTTDGTLTCKVQPINL